MKIGADHVYFKLLNQTGFPKQPYCNLTSRLLGHISCLPGNILEKMRFPDSNSRFPSTPLENALKAITLHTPITFPEDPNKAQHRTFLSAINLFKKHIDLSSAVIAVTIGPKTNELGETWNDAPLQLKFSRTHTNIYGGLNDSRRKETICVDLNGLRIENKNR